MAHRVYNLSVWFFTSTFISGAVDRANTPKSHYSFGGISPRKPVSDLCESAPALPCSGSCSVQPSVCRSSHKPRSMHGVHPLHKCSVKGFWEICLCTQHQQKRKSCSVVTPCWMIPQKTRGWGGDYLSIGILFCELKPKRQTQRQRFRSLLASFHVCFVSSYPDIMRTVLMPLGFTRFPLNLIQNYEKNNLLLVEIMMLPSKMGLKL